MPKRFYAISCLLVAALGLLVSPSIEAQEKPAKQDVEAESPDKKPAETDTETESPVKEIPEGWVLYDPSKDESDLSVLRAPMAKGEFFPYFGIVASEEGKVDPFWNLRSSQEWYGKDVWRVRSDDGENASVSTQRLSLDAYPQMHKGKGKAWNFVHSPTVFARMPVHLRFRRDAVTVVEGGEKKLKWQYSSELVVSRAKAEVLAKLTNLADSPRAISDKMLFRIFPQGDEQAYLELYGINPAENPEYQMISIGKYQPEGFNYVSRPIWLSPTLFVCVRAPKMLMQDIGGKARPIAYQGELVAVTVKPPAEAGAAHTFESEVLRRDFQMPVETLVTPFHRSIDNQNKWTLKVLSESGDRRSIVSIPFDRAASKIHLEQISESPKVKGLKAMWLAPASLQSSTASHTQVLIGDTIMLLHPKGYVHPAKPQKLAGVSAALMDRTTVTLFYNKEALPSGPLRFKRVLAPMAAGPTPESQHWSFKSEAFEDSLIQRSWLAENSQVVKRFDEVFKKKGRERLNNMALIYQANILVEQKGVSNKSGTMLEIWKRESRRQKPDQALLRSEDNLSGKWQVRSLADDKLYVASDSKPTLSFNANLPKDRLKQQLRVRRLLNFAGAGDANQAGMRFVGQATFPPVLEDGSMGKPELFYLFVRKLEDGTIGRYGFSAKDEKHNARFVDLTFQLGDNTQRVDFFIDSYSTIPDLSGDGKPLLVPSDIRAHDRQTRKLNFTLKLKASQQRASSTAPIKSGYNMRGITDKDFTESFKLD